MLLINADLSNPPSTISCFRDLTLYVNCFLNVMVLLELDMEHVDIYYHWLREKGAMDFVYDFVDRGTEYGVRVDTKNRFSGTVCVTDRIIPENLQRIIGTVAPYLIEF